MIDAGFMSLMRMVDPACYERMLCVKWVALQIDQKNRSYGYRHEETQA